MPGASNKNGLPHYGFNDREVDFIIKAMITLAENNVKPDFEKLAKMTKYKDAPTTSKNWNFTHQKLKAIGSNADGEATTDNKVEGNKRGKRQAVDMPEAPPAKRGRKRKTAEQDEDEEEKFVVKGEPEDN